jgi:hypothetical protein
LRAGPLFAVPADIILTEAAPVFAVFEGPSKNKRRCFAGWECRVRDRLLWCPLVEKRDEWGCLGLALHESGIRAVWNLKGPLLADGARNGATEGTEV